MSKRVMLAGAGLVVLGLISGLYGYESVKGRYGNMKENMTSATADHAALPPQPG